MTAKKTPAKDSQTPNQTDPGSPEIPAELVVEDAEIPTPTRNRGRVVTPFDGHVAALEVDARGENGPKGKRFKVPAATLDKVRRQLTSAGDALNPPVTVKWSTVTEGDTATVSIWAVTKRTRKPKEAAAASEEAPADAPESDSK